MSTARMTVARLYGVRDLRVESVPMPEPGPGELLVRIEGCGICPTDVRKYLIGVSGGDYPFNPGHEWVGRVEAAGPDAGEWHVGQRVYGDTYAGYAEFATLPAGPGAWSHGPLELTEGLPLERAIFVEPLADCLHAVRDQARVSPGDRLVVVGGGQMGLQLVLAGVLAGADVLCVEPLAGRRALALRLGAAEAVGPDRWAPGGEAEAVILSIGAAALVERVVAATAPGGRVVLFAGFGDEGLAAVPLNRIHYEEIALVGSEWIGTPPNQRWEHYAAALTLLESGEAPLEELVTARCGFAGIEAAFEAQREHRDLKTLLVPEAG